MDKSIATPEPRKESTFLKWTFRLVGMGLLLLAPGAASAMQFMEGPSRS